jgi:hypothetical protein
MGTDSTGQGMTASLFIISGAVIGNTAFPPHIALLRSTSLA